MTENEWLLQLKAGDEVFISQNFGRAPVVGTISRVTAKQAFIRINERYEQAYWKKDGYAVGGDVWSRGALMMPNDDIRAKVEIAVLQRKATGIQQQLTIPQDKTTLLAFIAAIEPFVKTVKPRHSILAAYSPAKR